MPRLSVIIIAKNEAHDIRQTLDSIRWADEIIVLDSGSTDGTAEICREYTDKVFITDWPGFGPQKNRALAYATGDWILSLDADERVSGELRHEIMEAMMQTKYDAYWVPRISTFCGKLIKHGAWRSDGIVRLFKHNFGHFSDDLVHEKVIVDGKVGQLSAPLWHDTYRDLTEMLEKVNSYSTYSAEMRAARHLPSSLGKAVGHGFWAFFSSYFLKAGFLDGKEGLMIAIANGESSYYRYLKLMYLNQYSRDIKL